MGEKGQGVPTGGAAEGISSGLAAASRLPRLGDATLDTAVAPSGGGGVSLAAGAATHSAGVPQTHGVGSPVLPSGGEKGQGPSGAGSGYPGSGAGSGEQAQARTVNDQNMMSDRTLGDSDEQTMKKE